MATQKKVQRVKGKMRFKRRQYIEKIRCTALELNRIEHSSGAHSLSLTSTHEQSKYWIEETKFFRIEIKKPNEKESENKWTSGIE